MFNQKCSIIGSRAKFSENRDLYKIKKTNHPLHSNFNSREFDTREVFLIFGHNFLGCGSYDLGIWQDFSPMSPLPSYTY